MTGKKFARRSKLFYILIETKMRQYTSNVCKAKERKFYPRITYTLVGEKMNNEKIFLVKRAQRRDKEALPFKEKRKSLMHNLSCYGMVTGKRL